MLFVSCYQDVDVATLSVTEEVDASYTSAMVSVRSSIASKKLFFRAYIATDSNMNSIIQKVELGDAREGAASVAVTDLEDGNQYYYQIECYSTASKKKCEVKSFSTLTALCPTVQTTQTASNITSTSAVSGGIVVSDGGVPVTGRGVCWSTSQNPTISNDKTTDGSGTGSFNSSIQGLTRNTTYYVRAYATNRKGTSYGDQYSFTTTADLPTVTTTSVSSVTGSSAIGGGSITDDGGSSITARGICWSTSPNPTVGDNHTTNGSGTGTFTGNMTGLTGGTTYYVRAYATNSAGTGYGDQVSFTTSANSPVVTTSAVSNITSTSATCGGNVTSSGGSSVSGRGVCWSTSSNPSIYDNHTTNGSGTGSFTSSLTGLTPGTTYHVRAYATNSIGTSYGTQVSFTTSATIPTVTTSSVSNITGTSASCGGNVTATGGASVTARGVCWSTSQNPTISNSHTTNGTGTGSFTSSIAGLTGGTTYYVRAYATNSAGTSYGSQMSFTTSTTTPTVTTSSVSDITGTTALCGGNVTAAGGASVTERGVCWSTSQNPTISNSHTTNGTGTGSFTSSITGLTTGTTYYVRAYATNSVGTSYGAQVSFTTSATTPTVTTSSVSSITRTSASCGGNVTTSGGASVTSRGVCWSTSQNPTISNSHTTNGTGTGSFTSSITGLSEGTTYYVRAYATNSAGTAYGNQVTFTTGATTTGALTGLFSVSSTNRVRFSMGNLQYRASNNSWRFASAQYSVLGSANDNISSSNSGWIDLFGYGTSGYNGAYPYNSSISGTYPNSNISGTQYDWGVHNAISNGGNTVGIWRTLTNSEWSYLLNNRPNASVKRGSGSVNGVYGLIILPDSWTIPSGCTFSPTTHNTYSLTQWNSMQSAGAVFLPFAGYRSELQTLTSYWSHYWSSTIVNASSSQAYFVKVENDGLWRISSEYTAHGNPVRLVVDD